MPRQQRRNRDGFQGDHTNDDEEEIQYGIRRSRRATSFQYRDSSSISPAQIMEQEVYYEATEGALEEGVFIAQLIILLLGMYSHFRAMVGRLLIRGDAVMADIVSAARVKMLRVKNTLEKIVLLLRWTMAYAELAFLYAEDQSVFIRRRHRFHPKCFRRINDIDRHNCYIWFGLNPNDLRRLVVCLRIPHTLTTPTRHSYGGEECFIIMLFHMIKGLPFTEMARQIFGGDPRHLSLMFDLMVKHLYITFYHKISGTSMDQWIPTYLHRCRRLIYNSLSDGALEVLRLENGEVVDRQWILHHFQFDSFRPFGFLDDFGIQTARPGSWARRLHQFEHDIQRSFYSGYFRRHGLKAQVVYLPIGIIGSVFITELRQNDNGVQNISGLNNYLIRLLRGCLIDQLYPCLYCDGIFATLATILPRFNNPTPELHLLNMRLASLRQCIEHVFADHRIRFKLFDMPHYLHLFNQGVKVRRMSLVSFLLLNCFYCIAGTRCRYFGHAPPTLEDYLPLSELLHPPPAVNLGNVWDYGNTATTNQ